MSAALYVLIASGFYDATGKFWKSVGWPVYLGELIGREALKREAAQ